MSATIAAHPGPRARKRRSWRRTERRVAAAVLLTLSATTLIGGLAVTAEAGVSMREPEDDGSCATSPATYPVNGIPVPADALCTVIATDDGATVGEMWFWRDVGGLHWYNFAVDGYLGAGDTALVMCASTDDGAAGGVYICTDESTTLLFTMPNLFVTWPPSAPDDYHFCSTVRLIDPFGYLHEGRACGSVISNEGEPPTSPPASESTPPSTSEPTESPANASTPPTPPPATTAQVSDPPTTTTASTPGPSINVSGPGPGPQNSTAPGGPTGSTPDPRDPPEGPSGLEPRPDDASIVAVVEGGRFPVAIVVLVALALALVGIGVLVGPGLMQARRRRV